MTFLLWLWDTRVLHTLAALAILVGWWRVMGREVWAAWRDRHGWENWHETHVTGAELRRIRRDYAITDEQQQDGWR